MARFVCPKCKNAFRSDAETAVCNGLVVKADEDGNPLAEDGSPLAPGGEPVLSGEAHTPVVMERKKR